jgi:hypothetical protein
MSCSSADTNGPDGDCLFIPSGTDPDSECPGPQLCTGAGGCTK